MKLDQESAHHYLERAATYLLIGEIEKAREDYVQAVYLDPENRDSYIALAIEHCTTAIQLNPDNGALYHQEPCTITTSLTSTAR